MATISQTQETRLIFTLTDERGINTKQRTIAIPGTPADGQQGTVLTQFKGFRDQVLSATAPSGAQKGDKLILNKFVQASTWRDDTGSTTGELGAEVLTTIDIEIEFYTATKTRYGADDLEP